ncbi:MAG: acyl-CoA carboxylase subunit beta [Solirubrobacteraceae bacterium]
MSPAEREAGVASEAGAREDAGVSVGGGDMPDRLAELQRRREEALAMGGAERVRRHRESGRQTVRQRLDMLLDEGSLYELGLLAQPERVESRPAPADAIVTGFGLIAGRRAAVIGIDATVLAGTTAQVNMRKQTRIAELAGRAGVPLLFLADADGGRIPDVMGWRFSGLPFDFRSFLAAPAGCPAVPRLAAALGPCFGDAALHASGAHFVVMTERAAVALSGPPVVAGAIGEEVDPSVLGGPKIATASGLVHEVVADEPEALAALLRFLSYVPDSAACEPPRADSRPPARDAEELLRLVPAEPRRAYDMRRVLEAIFDGGSIMQWASRWGASLLTALARLEGMPIGVVASQPMQRAGVLDVDALSKAADFARMCDTFGLPLVFLHDVPGLMIGTQAEEAGIVRAYERLVATLSRVRVPRIGVIVRKSYGGGNFAMSGRPTAPDLMFAWPTAELGFMAPRTGVATAYRRRLERVAVEQGQDARRRLHEQLEAEWAHESEPWEAAAHIYLDDVIDPRSTRDQLSRGIDYVWGSRPRTGQSKGA